MATQIIVPSDLWEEDEEAVVTEWLADDGATVEEGALIAEIMCAKVQYEITAPASGVLRIKEAADAIVSKGSVLGEVE